MTELKWDGKDGKRAAPVRIELPFQTVETVMSLPRYVPTFSRDRHNLEMMHVAQLVRYNWPTEQNRRGWGLLNIA